VINKDGSMDPVPTKFVQNGGQNSAVIKRKTNSTYTVIENKKTFADVAGHWAKNDVDILASNL